AKLPYGRSRLRIGRARRQRPRSMLGRATRDGRHAPRDRRGRCLARDVCVVGRTHFEDDAHVATVLDARQLLDAREEAVAHPFAMERVRARESQCLVERVARHRSEWVDPRREGERRELARKTADHAVPDLRGTGHATIPTYETMTEDPFTDAETPTRNDSCEIEGVSTRASDRTSCD